MVVIKKGYQTHTIGTWDTYLLYYNSYIRSHTYLAISRPSYMNPKTLLIFGQDNMSLEGFDIFCCPFWSKIRAHLTVHIVSRWYYVMWETCPDKLLTHLLSKLHLFKNAACVGHAKGHNAKAKSNWRMRTDDKMLCGRWIRVQNGSERVPIGNDAQGT